MSVVGDGGETIRFQLRHGHRGDTRLPCGTLNAALPFLFLVYRSSSFATKP